MAKINCTAKHTKYDPISEDFVCPACGAKEKGAFVIDTSQEDAHEECLRLHSHDRLFCYKCKYETTGTRFANSITKRKNLVPCPTCKGHGMVAAPK